MAELGKCRVCKKVLKDGIFSNSGDLPALMDATQCEECYQQGVQRPNDFQAAVSPKKGAGSNTNGVVAPTSSMSAIEFVSSINALLLSIGLFLGLGTSIVGIISNQNGVSLLAGFAIALISVFVFAVNLLFIGIARDIRAIREKLLND